MQQDISYGLTENQQNLLNRCLNNEVGIYKEDNFQPIAPMSPRFGISYIPLENNNLVDVMNSVGSHSLEIADTNKSTLGSTSFYVAFEENLKTLAEHVSQDSEYGLLFDSSQIQEEANHARYNMSLILKSVFENNSTNPLIDVYSTFIATRLSSSDENMSYDDVLSQLKRKKFGENLSDIEAKAIVYGLQYELDVINKRKNTEIQGLKDVLVLQAVQDLLGIQYLRNSRNEKPNPYWIVGFGIDLEGMGKLNNSIGPSEVNNLLTYLGTELVSSSRFEDFPFRTFRNAGDEYGLIMKVGEMSEDDLKNIFESRAIEITGKLIAAQLDAIQSRLDDGKFIYKTAQQN